MIKFNVEENITNKKIVTYLKNKFNNLSDGTIYKALRNKDIRVNNTKISENIEINKNDEITLYIKDELLYNSTPNFEITKAIINYEDNNIIVINKPQGILVVSENNEIGLDKAVKKYLNNYSAPCHRLDRNTKGLIIFAKNKEAEQQITEAIKNKKIRKFYKALVIGKPSPKSATLKAYLFKDNKKRNVIISNIKKKGYVEIITKYKTIKEYSNNTTLLEVELITGRTHQIRAHLSYINHPIVGDGKYGINEINKKLGYKYQELESYKIILDGLKGNLNYLNHKTIEIKLS